MLIGGAITSKAYTAVKIDKRYQPPVINVPDASRAFGVAGRLLSNALRPTFVLEIAKEYQEVRERRAGTDEARNLVLLEVARTDRVAIDWQGYVVH